MTRLIIVASLSSLLAGPGCCSCPEVPPDPPGVPARTGTPVRVGHLRFAGNGTVSPAHVRELPVAEPEG